MHQVIPQGACYIITTKEGTKSVHMCLGLYCISSVSWVLITDHPDNYSVTLPYPVIVYTNHVIMSWMSEKSWYWMSLTTLMCFLETETGIISQCSLVEKEKEILILGAANLTFLFPESMCGNIEKYIHHLPYLDTKVTQVDKILPHDRQDL